MLEKHKEAMYLRRIKSLQKQRDKLEEDYGALKAEYARLQEELDRCREKATQAEEARREADGAIEEARQMEAKFRSEFESMRTLRKRYATEMNALIRRLNDEFK